MLLRVLSLSEVIISVTGGSEEFSTTTLLCQVCSDKASGFHYGVFACEGCKVSAIAYVCAFSVATAPPCPAALDTELVRGGSMVALRRVRFRMPSSIVASSYSQRPLCSDTFWRGEKRRVIADAGCVRRRRSRWQCRTRLSVRAR